MGKIHWIPADDAEEIRIEETDKPPTLEQMQEWVGGYIELVSLSDRRRMIVNEEGSLLRMAPNQRATTIYWGDLHMEARFPVRGNVVILEGLPIE